MIQYKDFADLLNRMVASAPGRVALRSFDGEAIALTWAEFAARIDARTAALVGEGHTCEAILVDGTLDCVVEVFAAVRASLQVALIDPLMPEEVLVPLLHAVDADCVWSSNEARSAKLGGLVNPNATPEWGAHAVLFFTSGTTSSSKAVVLTDESLMASAFNGSSLLPLSPDDTLLCLLPLSHVFGFVCGLLWGLACGASVALGRGPRYYAHDFATFNPTAVAVVPKLLEFLVAHDALNEGLKLVLVGASDCTDDLLDRVRGWGIRVSLGYGLTETSSGVALSIGDDFHAMTICPDDDVSISESGEVLVKAPTCLMRGYYRDEEKTAAAVRNGVLHTGDQGFLDNQGLLHITGRIKDVLVLPGGIKVFLPDYESALMSALNERDIAVVLSEGRLTLVCGKMAQEAVQREIWKSIDPVMAAYPPGSRVGRVVCLNRALPRTAAGDVERWKLQEELEDDNH